MEDHADGDDDASEAIVELSADRSLGWGVLLAGLLILSPALFTAGPDERVALYPMVAVLVAIAAAIAVWNPWPRREPVRVTLDGDAVVVGRANGRTRRVPRAWIDRVELEPGYSGKPEVRLMGRWRTVRLEVSDRAAGDAVLRRLGLRRTPPRYWALSPLAESYPRMWGAGLLHFLSGVLLSTVALPLALIALFSWPFVLLWPSRRISVGADGVELRWMGRSRYIPYGDIQFLSVTEQTLGAIRNGVTLGRHEGGAIHLPVANKAAARALADALSAAMGARTAADVPLSLAARGERSHAEWVAHLRKADAADLRSAAVSRDELWRVVEDGNAPLIDRGAAAVALGKTLAVPERVRLADIAETVAAPKLRVVLEHSPDAEDVALAAMLEALERTARK